MQQCQLYIHITLLIFQSVITSNISKKAFYLLRWVKEMVPSLEQSLDLLEVTYLVKEHKEIDPLCVLITSSGLCIEERNHTLSHAISQAI